MTEDNQTKDLRNEYSSAVDTIHLFRGIEGLSNMEMEAIEEELENMERHFKSMGMVRGVDF